VVLSPPQSLFRDDLVRTQKKVGQGTVGFTPKATALSGTTYSRQEFEGTLEIERKSPHRRSTPLWVISAAVIVGATATLSAQAVIRRPGRLVSRVTHSSASANRGGGQPLSGRPTSGDVISAAAPVFMAATPTVVPSPAPVAPSAAPVAPSAASADRATVRKMVVTSERPRPVRALGQSEGRMTTQPRSSTGTPGLSNDAWVDPFVDEPAGLKQNVAPKHARSGTRVTTSRKTLAKSRRASSTSKVEKAAAWVDPFVN
jgi:hypothetical protein